MIRAARIDWNALSACAEEPVEQCEFDNPFGEASGAGAIFGSTGGVTEAALRTVAELMTGERIENVVFKDARGDKGIKEYLIDTDKLSIKGAVVSGTANAKKMLERIKAGDADYHFVEFMGCPGGCIMGGGQPIVDSHTYAEKDVWKLRAQAIYSIDESLLVRRSHENPFVKMLYADIGDPGGDRAHHLFHTKYTARQQYPEELP